MHSPEPWEWAKNGATLLPAFGECVLSTEQDYEFSPSDEDAERIVACVNACAGIPTERLAIMDLQAAIEILDSHQGNIDCNDYCGVARSLSRSKE